ncbi:MAG: hypothetical protein M1831_007144 [Alyxoria varia]|nr:MAG: hypothetical protein M1831_007144 [Alyxoria varia]
MAWLDETQYNRIGRRFGLMKQMPIGLVVKASVENLLGSLEGQRCLDLACGLGDFSHIMSAYGAKSVVGVDISQTMVEIAQHDAQKSNDQYVLKKSDSLKKIPNLTFRTGDCLKAKKYHDQGEEAFDVVFAGWLHNYALDRETLLEAWKSISMNLKPGGRFIGVIPHLPLVYKDLPGKKWELPTVGLKVTYLQDVPDGVKSRVTCTIPPEKGGPEIVEFDDYKLSQEAYETTAKEAGIKNLKYEKHVLPDDGIDGAKVPEWWDEYEALPHFDLITATI